MEKAILEEIRSEADSEQSQLEMVKYNFNRRRNFNRYKFNLNRTRNFNNFKYNFNRRRNFNRYKYNFNRTRNFNHFKYNFNRTLNCNRYKYNFNRRRNFNRYKYNFNRTRNFNHFKYNFNRTLNCNRYKYNFNRTFNFNRYNYNFIRTYNFTRYKFNLNRTRNFNSFKYNNRTLNCNRYKYNFNRTRNFNHFKYNFNRALNCNRYKYNFNRRRNFTRFKYNFNRTFNCNRYKLPSSSDVGAAFVTEGPLEGDDGVLYNSNNNLKRDSVGSDPLNSAAQRLSTMTDVNSVTPSALSSSGNQFDPGTVSASQSQQDPPAPNCFSADTLVRTVHGQTRMDQLMVGDLVLVPASSGTLKYERVELFYHSEPNTRARFLQITTESGKTLSLTALHMLPFGNCSEMRATTLDMEGIERWMQKSRFVYKASVGDCVFTLDDHQHSKPSMKVERIKKIGRIFSVGIYSPMTMEGALITNGILSSCFSQIESHTIQKLSFDLLMSIYRTFGYMSEFSERSVRTQAIPGLVELLHTFSRYIIPFAKY
ncbi:hypothetical protein niasHS_014482 [Heterodera schachtii]|uniref:Hint domain-containing protein n=1 Tax=Heterodera schachtii TaxID=97005 RepID=A0ABD2IF16_HETSC